jgi:hypothetical protein
MVRARVPTMRWLVIVAALVIGPVANSEPIHLACEGAMRANEPRQERLAEKYLMSLVIDLSVRTAKPEGHEPVPLKRSVEDEDIVAFASPKVSDDVLDGRLNRITGEALIHFLTDSMYEFHGRCHRTESLFENPHER